MVSNPSKTDLSKQRCEQGVRSVFNSFEVKS
jgi:hypothetical protein